MRLAGGLIPQEIVNLLDSLQIVFYRVPIGVLHGAKLRLTQDANQRSSVRSASRSFGPTAQASADVTTVAAKMSSSLNVVSSVAAKFDPL